MKHKYLIIFLLIICLTSINQIYATDTGNQTLTNDHHNNEDHLVNTMKDDFGSSDDTLVEEPKELKEQDNNGDKLTTTDKNKKTEPPKVNTKISTNDAQKNYYQKNIDYQVKLLDENNNPLIKQNLNLEISNNTFNKVYTSTTDENGNAIFKLTLNIGEFIAKTSYNGDTTHNPSVLNEKLSILSTIKSNNLNIYLPNNEAFVVTIFNPNGEYSENTQVNFMIDGKTYTVMTDYFGKAQLNINLDPGTYTIKTTANGVTVENEIEVINKTLTINPKNFYRYFTKNGVLKEEYSNLTLNFNGNFKEYGIISINSPVHINGLNAKFTNTVFHLNSDDITLDNINMHLTDSFEDNEYAGILITGNEISINNVFMNITISDKEALGIFFYGDEDNSLSDLKLTNSTIIFNATGNGTYYWGLALTNTDTVLISNNNITCSLPLRTVNWDGGFYGGISSDSVAGVAIQSTYDLRLENNYFKISGNSKQESFPTLDAVLIHSCGDVIIFNNTIIEEDFYTPKGIDNYLYALDVYLSNQVNVLANQIHLNTTGGKLAAGTAYGIQVSGPFSDFTIAYNNISTINNGPNIGIYSQNYLGDTKLIIFNNNINVTGLAGEHNWALVAGIEVQDTNDTIWNNTIEVHNVANSTIGNTYGISYSQNTSSNHTYDIQYNNVKTDSEYAVYINAGGTIKDTNVSHNVLVTKNRKGNDAVHVRGDGNYIGENTGDETINMQKVPEWLKKLVRLMNALDPQNTKYSYPKTPENSNSTSEKTKNNDTTQNNKKNIIVPKNVKENSNGLGLTNNTGNSMVPWKTKGNTSGINTKHKNNNNNVSGNGTNTHSQKIKGSQNNNNDLGISIIQSVSASTPGESGSTASKNKAYEVQEKPKKIINKDNYLPALIASVILLLLIFAGYKRKNTEEE